MPKKPTYEELECKIKKLEQAVAECGFRKPEDSIRNIPEGVSLKNDFDSLGLDLADIVDSKAIQSFMDDFYALTNIGVAILDLKGNVLVATGWQDICVKFHRVNPETSKNCLESDLKLSYGIKPGTFRLYRCKNNMWDMATPIVVGGRKMGNLYLGQFLFEEEAPDIDAFRRQAAKHGFDPDEYITALKQVPQWSRQTVDTVMGFYTKLAHLISELGYKNFMLRQIIAEKNNLLISLRESEKKYRLLFENAGDAIFIHDAEAQILAANPNACELLGYSHPELVSMTIDQVDTIEEAQHAPDQINQLMEIGHLAFETVHQHKDGSHIPIEVSARRITWDGQPAMMSICRDIRERKQTEASLYAIEWLLKKTAEKLPSPSQHYGDLTALNTERIILDSIGHEVLFDIVTGYLELLETSAAVYERHGDYAHGIFSSGWCQMLDSASRSLCDTDDNAKALSSGKWLCHESCWTHTSKATIQTGEPMDVECHGGLKIYAVPIKANDTVIGAINFGYGDPPKDMQRIEQIAEKYKVAPGELLKQANRYESRPAFIIEIAKKRLHGSAKLIGALVESKMAQSELQREREKLNVTLQSIGDGVITTDVKGNVVLVNKVAESLTGWTQEEARGKKLDMIFHIVNEHTRQRSDNPVEKVFETNGIVGLANDTLLVSRDGTEKIIADSGAPIVDHDGNTVGVVLVFRDITEKIKLETELRHAHKMEAIGSLAGGIAHEFNNVLGIIIGNTELATDDLEEWHPVYENLSEIKQAGLRAKDVVKQLLSFSRKMDIKREPIDIRIIVKESLKLLRASIPTSIRIRENLSEDIDTVVADATQIHQLLINLCNNAAQAMSNEGGTLAIELNNIALDYKAASKHPDLKPGDYVWISVSDTGHGIPLDMLDKIFDPYFTTKDVGKGTGMGLAVVHGIVKTHNGAIYVDSTIGKGTAFHVYFPSSKDKVYQKKIEEISLPRGKERILFVDDEVSIGKLCTQILEKLDYTVSSDADPMRTLERFRSDPNAYDLVISDMTMPNLTGDRLAQELLKIRPDVPIVICTGFSEKISLEKAHQLGIKSLLMKPVEKANLAKTVRKVLDEAKK